MKKYFSVERAVVIAIACLLSLGHLACEAEDARMEDDLTSEAALKTRNKMEKLPLKEIAQVRAETAPYHNFQKALADGWSTDLTGYVPNMGHHFANFAYLDGEFDMLHPEVLIFVGDLENFNARAAAGENFSNSDARLVGVEYLVPIPDLQNPPPAPEGFPGDADVWEINEGAQAWTLHLWIGLQNPDGIFRPHNMRLP